MRASVIRQPLPTAYAAWLTPCSPIACIRAAEPHMVSVTPAASIAVGAAMWTVYTVILRLLIGRRWLAMRAIAEMRHPEGDALLATSLASRLPTPVRQLVEDPSRSCPGSLAALLAEQSGGPLVNESPRIRCAWHDALTSMGASECIDATAYAGGYSFKYRDYVNFEELSFMLTRRGGLTSVMLTLTTATRLQISSTGACSLVDHMRLLGFVPLRIQWDGALTDKGDTIHWTKTEMRLGWTWLGRTIDRPSTAERLRQNPWLVRRVEANGATGGASLVLQNRGVGRLVFAR